MSRSGRANSRRSRTFWVSTQGAVESNKHAAIAAGLGGTIGSAFPGVGTVAGMGLGWVVGKSVSMLANDSPAAQGAVLNCPECQALITL